MIPLIIASTLFSSGPVEITAGQVDFENKTLSFSEKVELSLPKDASLRCPSASLNTESKKMILYGNPYDKIAYKEPGLSFTCLRIITELASKGPIQNLTAQGSVRITYGDDVVATGDNGYYTQKNNDGGIFTLASEEVNGLCELRHERGDVIKATTITFNPNKKSIVFNNPEAAFITQPHKTQVTAKMLTWDLDTRLITLVKNIKITQFDFGKFTASDTLLIRQTPDNKLDSLVGLGTISIALPNNQELTCTGSFTLDHVNNTLTLDGAPVHFTDKTGDVEAEHAVITYVGTTPKKITLHGNVKMRNFASVEHIASDTCLHYILTDFSTLDLETQTLYLLANPNNRTLIYDKINNIQVSAPSLTIRRDKMTKKETLKGGGDVRFSFSEKELNLLKQRFKMIQNAE